MTVELVQIYISINEILRNVCIVSFQALDLIILISLSIQGSNFRHG